MGNNNKINIIFIVGGDEVEIETNIHEPLHVARDAALKKSKETGRKDPNDWDVKDENKNVLDPNKKIETFGFADGVKLYLVPRVSGGGC